MGGNLEWGFRNAISTQVGEALNAQQLAAHDSVKHAHHQIKLTAAPATGGKQCINQFSRCFDAIDATSARRRGGTLLTTATWPSPREGTRLTG